VTKSHDAVRHYHLTVERLDNGGGFDIRGHSEKVFEIDQDHVMFDCGGNLLGARQSSSDSSLEKFKFEPTCLTETTHICNECLQRALSLIIVLRETHSMAGYRDESKGIK
jgi:hypothetical protein